MSASNKAKYEKLQSDLFRIEQETGLYLADHNVTRENIDQALVAKDWTPAYWAAMYACAASEAGMRAENAGRDINKMMGRVIY